MSFTFKWEHFDQEHIYSRAKELLTDALNKGQKPPIIVDRIDVQELSLGDIPPRLEILDIGDLGVDRFRGIFKLNYSGNASLTFATKIQANPLNIVTQNAPGFSFPKVVGAANPFPIPLMLTLSDIRMSGIIILVYSKAKGLTLVFRNDPLESIRVSSTFDALPGIAKFVQVQIENLIRTLFREELPGILHKLSQRWTPSYTYHQPEVVMIEDGGSVVTPKKQKPTINPFAITDSETLTPEFSRANMLKLAALSSSQRTLNLFTPSIPDVIYRSSLESFERRRQPAYYMGESLNLDAFIRNDDYHKVIQTQLSSPRRIATIKPKRRVIRLNKARAVDNKPAEQVAPVQPKTEASPLPSVPVAVRAKAEEATASSADIEPEIVGQVSTSTSDDKLGKGFFMSNSALQHEDVPPPYAAYAAA